MTTAPTMSDAAPHVSAVVGQRRGDPGRGRPAGMRRGANASTGIADVTASTGGTSARATEHTTYAEAPAATPAISPRRC
jgi:hypothetical protein